MTSSRFFGGWCIVLCLALAAVVAPATASAQEPTAEQRAQARELYAAGQAHFQAGEYQAALDAYQQTFQTVPNPQVLLAISLAQERLGHPEEARATLERYLILRPDAPDRAAVETRIAALPAATTGTVHVTCTPSGASIELDGHAIGTGTAETTTAPGSHELRVSLAGHDPITRQIDVTAGHRIDLELALVAQAAAPTEDTAVASTDEGGEGGLESADDVFGSSDAEGGEEESSEASTSTTDATPTDPSVGVWVTTAIAGVALVTGTVFGFLALSKQSDFDAMPTASTANDGEAFALVADLAFATAAAAGITAIVLYATERPPQPPEGGSASIQVLPIASPTGGGVGLTGHF